MTGFVCLFSCLANSLGQVPDFIFIFLFCYFNSNTKIVWINTLLGCRKNRRVFFGGERYFACLLQQSGSEVCFRAFHMVGASLSQHALEFKLAQHPDRLWDWCLPKRYTYFNWWNYTICHKQLHELKTKSTNLEAWKSIDLSFHLNILGCTKTRAILTLVFKPLPYWMHNLQQWRYCGPELHSNWKFIQCSISQVFGQERNASPEVPHAMQL